MQNNKPIIYTDQTRYSLSAEAYDRMLILGESKEQAARRVGIKKRSLEKFIQRLENAQQQNAA